MKRKLRLLMLVGAALVLGVAVALALGLPWASNTGSASPANILDCDVKASCDVGEVAVLRMSSTSNAHAGTSNGSSYGNVVCCGGVAGLGTSCSGVYDTVLTLSATDNAHVASDGSYPTEVCLSVGAGDAPDCIYGASCGTDYACLATISGSTNAHVADCDGSGDYATKVCCHVEATPTPTPTLPPAVGGIVELQASGSGSAVDSPGSSGGSSAPNHLALAGLAAAALAALAAGGWYARRRLS